MGNQVLECGSCEGAIETYEEEEQPDEGIMNFWRGEDGQDN
jgi:hypothetical protein